MTTVLFFIGIVLLILLLLDVHSTVFVPRGEAGLISRRLYRGMWSLWRGIGNRAFSGERRRWWLAQAGTLMVPMTVATWGALLIGAFSLIYARWLDGFSISPPESGPMPDWAILLYYSGYSAVTLGVGDIVPNGTIPRLLVVVQAGLGFALFTASISYLLSVYSARNASVALSFAISRLIGRDEGGDPVSLLTSVARSGAVRDMGDWLSQMAFNLASLVELRGQYPLLTYFHEPDDSGAAPIALTDLMELVTLCRAMLDPGEYPVLTNGPTIRAVERLGTDYLAGSRSNHREDDAVARTHRRRRYEAARSRFEKAGIALRADDEAWKRFDTIMAKWDSPGQSMREHLGYRHIDTPPASDAQD